MKRLQAGGLEAVGTSPCSEDLGVTHATIAQEDFFGAAALLGLSSGNPCWDSGCNMGRLDESSQACISAHPDAKASKIGRHVSKAARTSYSTRSYVWRGPHRGALAIKKKQLQQQPAVTDHMHCTKSDGTSSRRSSLSGAAVSDTEEVAQHDQPDIAGQGPYASARQRDKEWAALTTWLRMNLHHPRTAKKLVLFVGEQDAGTGAWCFKLNPGLTWDDVSLDTKLRLKTLPLEAEQAFIQKYPDRPVYEWGSKVQKYKPVNGSCTVNVCLRDMVISLSRIYSEHETEDNTAAGEQTAEQLKQSAVVSAEPLNEGNPDFGLSGPLPHANTDCLFTVQQQSAVVQSAAANTAVSTGAFQLSGAPVLGVPAEVAHAAVAVAAGCPAAVSQPQLHQAIAALPALRMSPYFGTETCTESATPVAARSSMAFAAAY